MTLPPLRFRTSGSIGDRQRTQRGPPAGATWRSTLWPPDGWAQEAVARRAPRGISNISVDALTAGRQVCVRIRGDVEYVFSRALPGAADGTTVEASAVATAVEGEAGTAVRASSIC